MVAEYPETPLLGSDTRAHGPAHETPPPQGPTSVRVEGGPPVALVPPVRWGVDPFGPLPPPLGQGEKIPLRRSLKITTRIIFDWRARRDP